MSRTNWVKGFAREHTFISVPFFLDAYTKRWKKSIGFVFSKVMVVYENKISTSYRTEEDLKRLDKFLLKLVKNTKKVEKILNTIQKNRILLINYSENLAKKDLSNLSLIELKKEYQAFFSLSLKFWDYHSMGYYLAEPILNLSESKEKNKLVTQIEEIRKDMPYIRCEKIVLDKLFLEISKKTNILFELLFYLTPKELLRLFSNSKVVEKLSTIADKRRTFTVFFYTAKSSKIFVGETAKLELNKKIGSKIQTNQKEIFGTIASQGIVDGEVFLVTGKHTLQNILKDSIVVIEKMMPEDIVFIKNAKGVICEEGGLGSHAAILCREYKIPCIVGVKNVFSYLKSKDNIILDATKGKISLK